MRTRCVALTLGLLAGACGGASPAANPPGASSASPSPAPSAAPASSEGSSGASPESGAGPTAKVTEVVGSAESTQYMKVTAVFTNPSSAPCSIAKYTLVWSGGTKEIKLDAFTIPPGSSRQRSVKVHPDDGDLKTLTMQSARINLPPKCGP